MMGKRLLEEIANIFIERHETLAVAESVTSGLIMATLSQAPNATGFFQGGLTAYNAGQKTRQLSVDPIAAEQTNCVSTEVSCQMAVHVAEQFCSQWGIGITGYAVPVPALKVKTCFAYYAITHHQRVVSTGCINAPRKEQQSVQRYFVQKTLAALLQVIRDA